MNNVMNQTVSELDPDIARVLNDELNRQREGLEMMLDESKQFTALNQAKKINDVIENAPQEWP
jgi:glycine hydroxymethyltransferase